MLNRVQIFTIDPQQDHCSLDNHSMEGLRYYPSIDNLVQKSSTGKDVLDYVCEFLNITEKDYFGLRYQDHHRHRVSW